MKVTIKKQLIFMLFLLLIPVWAVAQVITVKGTVKDNKSEALIGVSVREAGSATNAIISDMNGNFSIKVSKTATLIFSYIGYDKTTVKVDGRQVINVVLDDQS